MYSKQFIIIQSVTANLHFFNNGYIHFDCDCTQIPASLHNPIQSSIQLKEQKIKFT
jgi:hypothetical protein